MTIPAAELSEINAQWQLTLGEQDREAKNLLRERLMTRKMELLREDERSLLHDLRGRGFVGSSVWDLVNTRERYPNFVGVLADHASRDYLLPTREGIFRALTVRESGPEVLEILINQWRQGVAKEDKFVRWALANAIAYLFPRKRVTELAQLMDGDEYSNNPFVTRLKRSEAGRQALAVSEKTAL